MSEESEYVDFTADIATWLSDVPSKSSSDNAQPIEERNASINDCSPAIRKRKRTLEPDRSPAESKRSKLHQSPARLALTKVNLNSLSGDLRPVESRRRGFRSSSSAMDNPATPSGTPNSKKRKTTATAPSTVAKPTANVDSIRQSLAKQGMFFEDIDSYDKHADFKEHITKMFNGKRDSEMRERSAKACQRYRLEHRTTNENSYYPALMPMLLPHTIDRNELLKVIDDQAQSFATVENLAGVHEVLFVKNILPGNIEANCASFLGTTTPKPDYTYGLKREQYPSGYLSKISQEADLYIGVAPGVRHPFFCIEQKSASSPIEEAENQAIRSGATLVEARRILNRMANNRKQRKPEGQETGQSAPSVTTQADLPDQGSSMSQEKQKDQGLANKQSEKQKPKRSVDWDSFAFSCSWVPQFAKLHVHWYENRPGEDSIWHMNRIRSYCLDEDDQLSNFRADVHNILDFGCSLERRNALEVMDKKIAGVNT